jgi:hypothetical protein
MTAIRVFISSVQKEFALTDGFVVTLRRKHELAFGAVGWNYRGSHRGSYRGSKKNS